MKFRNDQGAETTALVSCYGFKGGVGRTLAAAHLAHLYSTAGQRVLLVDADLEAPGLSFWNATRDSSPTSGLAQLLLDIQSMAAEEISERTLQSYISDEDFFAKEREESASAMAKALPVALMAAGIGSTAPDLDAYLDRLPSAHEALSVAADKLRLAFERSPYDVVIMDSRAGLHRIGAAIITELTDNYVVLFGPSRQAQAGLRTALTMFNDDQLERAVFAMSPVAWQGSSRLASARRAIFRRAKHEDLGDLAVGVISWHPLLAHDERLITVADPLSATARDYRSLFLALETLRGNGIDEYTESVDALLDIFKASVAVDGDDHGLRHLAEVFKQERESAFRGIPRAMVASVEEYLEGLDADGWSHWRRREQFVRFVVWQIIGRLKSLAQLDEYAGEALWAIVLRRNHATSQSMRPRYARLYEIDDTAASRLPSVVNVLVSEYEDVFQRPSKVRYDELEMNRSRPNPEMTIEDFVASLP